MSGILIRPIVEKRDCTGIVYKKVTPQFYIVVQILVGS